MGRVTAGRGGYGWITEPVIFGVDVRLHTGVVIGEPPETRDPEKRATERPIHVGDRTHIREYVVIHRGYDRDTTIGRDCYLMVGAHVSHDVHIEDWATIAHRVVLGGHVTVMRGANVGIGALVHQWVTIGAYAMVGMGAVVVDDVPPGCKVVGNPARIIGANTLGLERQGVSDAQLAEAHEEFERVRRPHGRRLCRLASGTHDG